MRGRAKALPFFVFKPGKGKTMVKEYADRRWIDCGNGCARQETLKERADRRRAERAEKRLRKNILRVAHDMAKPVSRQNYFCSVAVFDWLDGVVCC